MQLHGDQIEEQVKVKKWTRKIKGERRLGDFCSSWMRFSASSLHGCTNIWEESSEQWDCSASATPAQRESQTSIWRSMLVTHTLTHTLLCSSSIKWNVHERILRKILLYLTLNDSYKNWLSTADLSTEHLSPWTIQLTENKCNLCGIPVHQKHFKEAVEKNFFMFPHINLWIQSSADRTINYSNINKQKLL